MRLGPRHFGWTADQHHFHNGVDVMAPSGTIMYLDTDMRNVSLHVRDIAGYGSSTGSAGPVVFVQLAHEAGDVTIQLGHVRPLEVLQPSQSPVIGLFRFAFVIAPYLYTYKDSGRIIRADHCHFAVCRRPYRSWEAPFGYPLSLDGFFDPTSFFKEGFSDKTSISIALLSRDF